MARRRSGNSHTTISVRWESKDEFRHFAKILKDTKNGTMYESDSVLFSRILDYYAKNNPTERSEAVTHTYPNKSLPNESQQDSSPEVPIQS